MNPLAIRIRHGDWRGLHRHLVWAYEGKPSLPYRKGRYSHINLSAWLIRRGDVRVEGGGAVVEAGPGTWVFPPFGEDERSFSEDLELLSICCQVRWPNGHMLFEPSRPHILPSRELPDLERTAVDLLAITKELCPRAIIDLSHVPLSPREFLRLEQALALWLVPFAEAMERLGVEPTPRVAADARAAQARERLDRHPLDREVDTAKLCGLGRSQLDRLFLAHYGLTPRRYLAQRRLDAALAALEGSHQPIKEIALGLGFKQYSHFSNWFKKQVGHSPRAVRKKALARTG